MLLQEHNFLAGELACCFTHVPVECAGFGVRSHEVTTTALIKALGEHIGKPLQLRVARPGGAVETLTVTALEATDPGR